MLFCTMLPVIGVILYLKKGSYREGYQIELCGNKNQYLFQTIRLWEYKEEIETGKRKELAPFLILFTDQANEEILRKEKELIMQVEDEKERADLLSIAMTLAFHYFKESWVKEYFKEEMQMIKTANIVQEWIDEGMQKGIEQGMQKGIAQGMQKGIEQGMQKGIAQGIQKGTREAIQKAIIEILEERFDLLPPDLIKSVKQIDEEEILDKLLRKAAKVDSLDKFRGVLKILFP